MLNLLLDEITLPLAVSFIVALISTYLVRIAAIKLRWISIPREERWNNRFVALMGGIAVFISFVITFLIFQPLEYLMVGLGGVLMFGVGFWDDRFEMKPIIKFLVQFLAASVLIASGFTISSAWPFWVAIPVTYLWIVGITNAFNLLDNMDGLAAGIAVIVSLVFGGLALKFGLTSVAVLCFILAGATGGFLVFNYNPAKIFMGDCGSLFIGYMLAAFPLMLEPALSAFSAASILPVLAAVTVLPIFDTTLVTFVRLFKGRSPSQGGSDHSSHRLVFTGLSEKAAVHILYSISAYFGLIVLLFYPVNVQLFYMLFTISMVGLFLFGLFISRLDVYKEEYPSSIESIVQSIPPYFKRKIQLATIIVDIVLITVSFTLAHIIRFETWSAGIEQAVIDVLPAVIVSKIVIIAAFGLYRSVWRYAGVADLTRLFVSTFIGSLTAGLFAWAYSTGGYLSASVFAIDWFLFLLLLSCSRFAFKGLRRLLSIPTKGGKNVILYGAGDAGWLALSEIRQNDDLHWNPIGFIDDSPYKQKGKIQELKVLGSCRELMTVCEDHKVEEVLICIQNLPDDKKEYVKAMCKEKSIRCRKFTPAFNELSSGKYSKESDFEFQYSE